MSRVPKISARAHAGRRVTNKGERRMLDDVLPTEARDEVRRKQAARPTTGEQAHKQKHGRTERWTDKRKLQ